MFVGGGQTLSSVRIAENISLKMTAGNYKLAMNNMNYSVMIVMIAEKMKGWMKNIINT